MQRLEEKVAIVTGGASGLGLAVARQMVAEGAWVVVADLDAARARAAAEELGPRAAAQEVDVGVERDVARMVRFALERFGRLDVLHNNAAALGAEVFGRDGGITAMDAGVWDATFAVIVRGAMLGCKHAIPAMRDGGGGAIVNTASNAGLRGVHLLSAYTASKHGIVGLTKNAAIEYANDNIRVNAVCPGAIMTPLMPDDPARRDEIMAPQAMKRFGQPEEVAAAVVWLCSAEASFVTGIAMPVDAASVAGW